VDSLRTEEEQVEALRRWWDENGRSTVVAIVLALGGAFGWQAWQGHNQSQRDAASDLYQAMLSQSAAGGMTDQQREVAIGLAERLKAEFPDSTYAQFAALQLARGAVETDDLAQAEAELRWVLGSADPGGDVALVTQLRLARVVSAAGDGEQALKILDGVEGGTYAGAYALARGDILLAMGREEDAREAYAEARQRSAAGGPQAASTLAQKLQTLSPVPAGDVDAEPLVLAPAGDQAAAAEGEG
jgi:predicted negative regulator of RcsB-dependent stress response